MVSGSKKPLTAGKLKVGTRKENWLVLNLLITSHFVLKILQFLTVLLVIAMSTSSY